MEEKIFPRPAVAGVLEPGFVEARLHTDGGPAEQENKDLQEELTGSVANPIYVIVEPGSGKKLRLHAGLTTESRFVEFLRGQALE